MRENKKKNVTIKDFPNMPEKRFEKLFSSKDAGLKYVQTLFQNPEFWSITLKLIDGTKEYFFISTQSLTPAERIEAHHDGWWEKKSSDHIIGPGR